MVMRATAVEEKKYRNGNEDFPILYEDTEIRVFKNPLSEIFVEGVRSGVLMRINACGPFSSGGLQFTTEGRVEPCQINSMIGWRVTPR